MYFVDNSTGVSVMPTPDAVFSTNPLWFTRGDSNNQPTYPGPDWMNSIQAEIMNVISAAGIELKKDDNTQLSQAIAAIIASKVVAPPVTSVNSKTGDVMLTAADVHALPDTYAPPVAPVSSVNNKTGAVMLSAVDVSALSSTGNLSEIAAAGADAQSATRQNLGLGDIVTHDTGDFLPSKGGTLTGDSTVLILKNATQGKTLYLMGKNADGSERFSIGCNTEGDGKFRIKNSAVGNYIELSGDGGVTIAGDGGEYQLINGQPHLTSSGLIKLIPKSTDYHVIVGGDPKKIEGLLQTVVETDYGIGVFAVNDAVTSSGTTTGSQLVSANSNKGWQMRMYVSGDASQDDNFVGEILVATDDNSVQVGFLFSTSGTFTPPSYANFDARYISNIQFGAQVYTSTSQNIFGGSYRDWMAPTGCTITGIHSYNDNDREIQGIWYKPNQKEINGTWVTIAG